jgi:hypothetical protein
MAAEPTDRAHVIATSPWPNAADALLRNLAAEGGRRRQVVLLDDGEPSPAAALLRQRADVVVNCRGHRHLPALWQLRRALRRCRAQSVWSWNAEATVAAAAVSCRQRVAAITDISTPRHGRRCRCLVRALRRAERVLCGDAAVRDLLARLGAPAERLEVTPPPRIEAPPLPPRAEARRRLGLPPDAPVLLTSGPWPHVEPVEPVTWATGFLSRTWPAMKLLVAWDGRLAPPVRATAQGSGVADCLVPLTVVGTRLPPDALAAADAFATATLRLGPSPALGEAKAVGLPVAVVDQPSSRLAIADYPASRLCGRPLAIGLATGIFQMLSGRREQPKSG